MPGSCAGIYGSQSRDDYSEDDIEHYFNYMGMLATEVGRRLRTAVDAAAGGGILDRVCMRAGHI
jgi:hypothetical protein